jgi:leucyl aminopeptidase
MKIAAATGKAERIEADLLALGLPEETKTLKGAAAELDKAMSGAISDVLASGEDFSGKPGQTAIIRPARGIAAGRVLLVGLGPVRGMNAESLRVMGGHALREAIALKLKSVALMMPAALGRVQAQDAAQALAEGAGLGGYLFENYRSSDARTAPETVTVVGDPKASRAIRAGANAGAIIAECAGYARDFINHPGNTATPTMLADEAKRLAKTHGLKAEIMGPVEIAKHGMGGLMAVAKGSSQPARFIVLKHMGGRSGAPVVLVGKGLTFDTGGISIKPAEGMEKMKYDMSGGAAVIGALVCAARLKLKVNVIGVVPSTENMSGASAYRPGDVLKMYDGQTIEIISTDAEGRLILSDALAYAKKKFKPAAMIDIATLTGACVIGLGNHACGVMGTDNSVVRRIEKAGEVTNEKVWRLPLWSEYFEQIKSPIADMKNTGGRPGGAITAAALLSKFVGDTPWAHLDIAGVAWVEKDKPYVPKGPAGFGVRLLVETVRSFAGKS